jgi:hypothetical protein
MLCIKKNKDESVWCDYPGIKDVSFKIRPLTTKTIENIKKPFIVKKLQMNSINREMEIIEIVSDEEAYNQAIIDYLIEDWKGVVDEDENPVECNTENKKEIMNIFGVATFIFEAAKQIPTYSNKRLKGEVKN